MTSKLTYEDRIRRYEERQLVSKNNFLINAGNVWKDRYDYSRVDYKNTHKHITVICKCHGEFDVSPANHLRGVGCPSCAKENLYKHSQRVKSKFNDTFIQECIKTHGEGRYSYSNSIVDGSKSRPEVLCLVCNAVFYPVAIGHRSGSGCPECAKIKRPCKSKKESIWLDSLDIPSLSRSHKIITPNYKGGYVIVDGFDPDTNTVYEYYGKYWHGHPEFTDHSKICPYTNSTFGELYENTKRRELILIQLGYQVVSQWES